MKITFIDQFIINKYKNIMTLNFTNVNDFYNISLCFQENLYIKIIDTISFIEYELFVDDVSNLSGIPTVKSLYGILKGILKNNTECIKFITHQNDLELDITVTNEYYEFNFKLFLNKIKMIYGDEKYTKKILQLEDKINNMQLALDNCSTIKITDINNDDDGYAKKLLQLEDKINDMQLALDKKYDEKILQLEDKINDMRLALDKKYDEKILQLEDKINDMQLALDTSIDEIRHLLDDCSVTIGFNNNKNSIVKCSVNKKILHICDALDKSIYVGDVIYLTTIDQRYFKFINYEEIYIGSIHCPFQCQNINFSKFDNKKVKKISIYANSSNNNIIGIQDCKTLEELCINGFSNLIGCSMYLERLNYLKKVIFTNCICMQQKDKDALMKLSLLKKFLLDIQ